MLKDIVFEDERWGYEVYDRLLKIVNAHKVALSKAKVAKAKSKKKKSKKKPSVEDQIKKALKL